MYFGISTMYRILFIVRSLSRLKNIVIKFKGTNYLFEEIKDLVKAVMYL